MPVPRSIMKKLALPSNKERLPRLVLLMVAMAMFMAMAAQAATTENKGGSIQKEQSRNPAQGRLLLEDPRGEELYAAYDVAVGDSFSITFIHSVNQSPVIDVFEIREDGIYGVKTIYYGFGAGVPTELEEGQILEYGEDGSMIISGIDVKLDNLIYRVGTVSDHTLSVNGGEEISLRDLCGRNARVAFRFEQKEDSSESDI